MVCRNDESDRILNHGDHRCNGLVENKEYN